MAVAERTDKGLAHDSVGLLGSVVLALSSVAPAYALTATLGPTVTEVGGASRSVLPRGDAPARYADDHLSLTLMKSE